MPKIAAKPLTALQVKKLSSPGKYPMGEGLYLEAKEGTSGQLNKRWYWRGTVHGNRQEIGIGPYPQFSLLEARELAREWAKAAKLGQDPKKVRDKDKLKVLTFEEAVA